MKWTWLLLVYLVFTIIQPAWSGGSAGWWDIGWETDYVNCMEYIGEEICVGEKRDCSRTVNLYTCFENNLCFINYCYTPGSGTGGGGDDPLGQEADCLINPMCYLAN